MPLNNLFYNLQNDLIAKFEALIIPGENYLSWRVFKQKTRRAKSKAATQELIFVGQISGKIPHADVRGEIQTDLGSFTASIKINLSQNTAEAVYGATLDSDKVILNS